MDPCSHCSNGHFEIFGSQIGPGPKKLAFSMVLGFEPGKNMVQNDTTWQGRGRNGGV